VERKRDDPPCPFCTALPAEIVTQNSLAYGIFDTFPANPGHMLAVPFRHTADFFSLLPEERTALFTIVDACRAILEERYSPDGYTIGVNVGPAAGQTIPHVHIHIIPRYAGDVENPRGGVRGVIPSKREYPC
jgi:diadenosine tetraphosphate (Ap4A) HIT family hydrolase